MRGEEKGDRELIRQAVKQEPGLFSKDGECLGCPDSEEDETYITTAHHSDKGDCRTLICDGCGNALALTV